jgi:hypothetical protein
MIHFKTRLADRLGPLVRAVQVLRLAALFCFPPTPIYSLALQLAARWSKQGLPVK